MSLAAIARRLGRVTTSGRVIPQIDGLRFVAIGTVVVFHMAGFFAARSPVNWRIDPTQTWAGRLAGTGHYGVELFFGISGFILALPFAKFRLAGGRKPMLGAYYLRRLTRLEPPYIVSLLLFFSAQVLFLGREFWAHLGHLLASLVYQHNLVYAWPSRVNGVAWSLEIEVQFYVLAPLLALVYAVRRRAVRRAVMLGIWAVALALKAWWASRTDSLPPWIVLGLPYFFVYFWGGFLLADWFVEEKWDGAPTRAGWDLVSLLGWPLLTMVWLDERITPVVFPLLVPLLYAAALRGTWSSKVFSNRWAVALGGMCYTIYLFHYPVVSAVGRFTKSVVLTDRFDVNLALQLVLVTPAVALVGATLYLLVEQPCMRPDWPARLGLWIRQRFGTGRRVVAPGEDG